MFKEYISWNIIEYMIFFKNILEYFIVYIGMTLTYIYSMYYVFFFFFPLLVMKVLNIKCESI